MDDKKLLPQMKSIKTLLIKPKDISGFDYKNPDYRQLLLNLDIYKEQEIQPESFGNQLYQILEMKDFSQVSVNTQAIYSDKNYMYELVHLDLPIKYHPMNIYNGMANLLKNDLFHIFGNALLMKTRLNPNDNSTIMVDCTKKDLDTILLSRVKHRGVTVDLDGEIEEIEYWYDPKTKIEEFIPEGKNFQEDMFLLHNLQIHFTRGDNPIFEKILGEKIEQMIILTKITDNLYGDFTLEEFNKILKLLEKDCPKLCKEEWKKEEKDEYNRNIVINKYRVLEKALKEYGLSKQNI